MDYWNNILTEKSWNTLMSLRHKKFRFILIGGWAAYLYSRTHKSKDIDIIIPDYKDLDYLKKNYNLKKNDQLKKYEINMEEIDIDIYIPYYSKLALPIEEIAKHTTRIEGFEVIKPEILLILKQGAEQDRENSTKGEKDRIDIMSLLLFTEIDFKLYHELLKKHSKTEYYERLKRILNNFKETKYLNITPRELKKKKEEIMKKMKER